MDSSRRSTRRHNLEAGTDHALAALAHGGSGFEFAERLETFVEGTGRTHMDVLYARERHRP